MRNSKKLIGLATLFFTIVVSPVSGQFFAPDAVYEEKTIPQWVADHTNWETNVVFGQGLDTVNVHPDELATVMNDGPVFFIAGLDFDNPESTLRVPPGRPILQRIFDSFLIRVPQPLDADGVPVDLSGNPTESEGLFDADATFAANVNLVDSPPFSPFFWEFDGEEYTQEQISAQRVDQFYTSVVTDDFVGPDGVSVAAGEYPMSVQSGFWFMHEPFDPGERHTVKLGSLTPEGERFPEFTVHLVAVPEPSSTVLAMSAILGLILLARRTNPTSV